MIGCSVCERQCSKSPREWPKRIALNWSVKIKPVNCNCYSGQKGHQQNDKKKQTYEAKWACIVSTECSQIEKVTTHIKHWQSEYWLAVVFISDASNVRCCRLCNEYSKKKKQNALWISSNAENLLAHSHCITLQTQNELRKHDRTKQMCSKCLSFSRHLAICWAQSENIIFYKFSPSHSRNENKYR